MNKTLVQEQFGKTAASYLTSTPHALGKSLERLVSYQDAEKSCFDAIRSTWFVIL